MEGDQGAETAKMFLQEEIAKGSCDSVHPPCCLGFTTSTWCGGEKAAFAVEQSWVPSPAASLLACVILSKVLTLSRPESRPYSLQWTDGTFPAEGLRDPGHSYTHSLPPLEELLEAARDTLPSLPSPPHFLEPHSLVPPPHTWTCSGKHTHPTRSLTLLPLCSALPSLLPKLVEDAP